uniref:(California timema) hypothetical protein n=1 Tax=Timema californicum TaxID=61474 RepID=A0A7R9JHI1_TIMCA|nr:unnamed protein product [Timema californicum]
MIGYILADAGFDVWLGNYRGNSYSNQHISLDTDSADYWDFSWHENGFYDLPAMIDHIRSQTGQDKIYYIGHSMGTTGFFVMGSMRPEYNDKIRAMFSLAPIAYMSHMTSPFLQLISQYITELQVQLLQSSCTLEESMFTLKKRGHQLISPKVRFSGCVCWKGISLSRQKSDSPGAFVGKASAYLAKSLILWVRSLDRHQLILPKV